MKLIYAIVNNDDGNHVSSSLTKAGFFATKLATTGGFLRAGNTTFMICTEAEKVDEVINIIGVNAKKRTQLVPASDSYGMGAYSSMPIEVTVGGATVFVTDVERFEKL